MTDATFAHALGEHLGWPVTPEAVLAWETTAVPPGDVLLTAEAIAETDGQADEAATLPAVNGMRLIDSYEEVQAALAAVVEEAEEVLTITGSRSRDPDYLARIESAVTAVSGLVYYRVLYGPPRHGALKNHLLRVVDLHRPPGTVNLGVFWDLLRDSERFICACEKSAVVVLPSLTSLHNFDTALVIDDPDTAGRWVTHVRQAYLAAEALTTRADIESLEIQR